jgi:putative PIN family toxin of toxin-antitoxin system
MKNIVVIDTNILVAATRSSLGSAFAFMGYVRLGRVAMCCSPALFLEYEAVLKRSEQLAASGLRVSDDILSDLATLIVPVVTHYHWRPQLRDPSDEMVLEAAVNASATAIVTYNLKDFMPAFKFGLKTLSPQQAITSFGLVKSNRNLRSVKP